MKGCQKRLSEHFCELELYVAGRIEQERSLIRAQPPRGCVLVSWARSGPEGVRENSIIQESKLVLLDRALLVADIVKKSPTDAMSGTVINSTTRVTLMPPFPWPAASSQPGPPPPEAIQGCFSSDPDTFLEEVPAHELKLTSTFVPGNFIVYHDWVGRIEDTEDEITLRLADGSLVVPEDSADLLPAQETYYVNDFLTTKKANLRLGRWIYGAYNPNINPCGHVAQVRVVALEVRWLASKYSTAGGGEAMQYDEPPFELDEDILESGEVYLYDESVAPSFNADTRNTGNARVGLELAVGDRVQFKDLTGAAVKYPRLRVIPRSDTLGKDTNTFVVQSTRSEVTVLWQDLTTSTCAGKDLIPFLDIGDGDEVWPGDMVMTKASVDVDDGTFSPVKFGIVQSVQSQERMATVSWCSGKLVFVKFDTSIMLTCQIGPPTGEVETCSFYDITNPAPLERRLGDFVLLLAGGENYTPRQGRDWFGEIVSIGLDGQLTVRLGAADEVRDVKVPFSSTTVLFSSDLHDEDHGLDPEAEDDEDMSDDYEDDDVEYDIPFDEADDAPWMNENNEIVGEEDQGWTTDEGDQLSDSDDGSDIEMADGPDDESREDEHGATNGIAVVATKETPTTEPTEVPLNAVTHSAASASTFSYSTMFGASETEQGDPPRPRPLNFEILDGSAPMSHHFSGQAPSADVQRLRRITAEHKILRSSLPDGVFVRTWEGSLDLLRVLILGPLDTPYEYAPFVIDFSLAGFPQEPPQAFFHSWTDGSGPVNPNLYEDGKICLSLLGTWPGEVKHETWTSKSTILQVLVSILGLVLVREPYYSKQHS